MYSKITSSRKAPPAALLVAAKETAEAAPTPDMGSPALAPGQANSSACLASRNLRMAKQHCRAHQRQATHTRATGAGFDKGPTVRTYTHAQTRGHAVAHSQRDSHRCTRMDPGTHHNTHTRAHTPWQAGRPLCRVGGSQGARGAATPRSAGGCHSGSTPWPTAAATPHCPHARAAARRGTVRSQTRSAAGKARSWPIGHQT
jgi:hypothetical protein